MFDKSEIYLLHYHALKPTFSKGKEKSSLWRDPLYRVVKLNFERKQVWVVPRGPVGTD